MGICTRRSTADTALLISRQEFDFSKTLRRSQVAARILAVTAELTLCFLAKRQDLPPGSWRSSERCGGDRARTGSERHFGIEKGVVHRALRRPGALGLIAGRIPAASDLVGIYEDVGTGWMAHRASPRWNSQPLNPKGRRSALSEHPLGVFRSNGRSSRRSPPRRGTTVMPLRGVREASTTKHATYPGQDKNCWDRASGAHDLFPI